MSNITRDHPQLTIDKLKASTDYKFRFTPVLSDAAAKKMKEANPSQLSLVLDVKMPSKRRGRCLHLLLNTSTVFSLHCVFYLVDKDTDEVATPSVPPQFSMQKIDATSVLIEAVVPGDQPAAFEDVYDVFSKKDTSEDDWAKVRKRFFLSRY